ncbi:MAG: hypothetical protein QXU45_03380 [Candidatus Bathyarchaeia archaeon]
MEGIYPRARRVLRGEKGEKGVPKIGTTEPALGSPSLLSMEKGKRSTNIKAFLLKHRSLPPATVEKR